MVPSGEYEKVRQQIATAIHNNHGAPPGSVTCFMCRRDAEKVLEQLCESGFCLTQRAVETPLAVP